MEITICFANGRNFTRSLEYMKKDGKPCKGCAKTTAGCGSHKKMIATSAKADSIIDKLERTMELLQNVETDEVDAEIIEETNASSK